MEREPQRGEPDGKQPCGDQAGADPGWRGAWLLLLGLFAVLAGACIVMIYTLGRAEAFETGGFWVLLILTILAGLTVGARNLLVELHDGAPIDRRNHLITASWRRVWWQRWRYGEPRDDRDAQ